MALQQALVLDFNADSTEFCPWHGPAARLLAAGTYQLDEPTQQRLGRLYLYAVASGQATSDGEAAESLHGSAPAVHLQPLQQMDMPGIFDLKWSPAAASQAPSAQQGYLGAALADGTLRLYRTAEQSMAGADNRPGTVLEESSRCQACSEGMALSLDWQVSPSSAAEAHHAEPEERAASSSLGSAVPLRTGLVAVSGSAGTLSVIQERESELAVSQEWTAHTLEAWSTAFSRSQDHILYSGADDCCFKAWDLRDTGTPAFCNRRAHGAGVCTISPHPTAPHLVATGSYDEQVRLWDVRMPEKPLLLSQVGTGGGNWRLRWHPSKPTLLLAACMYNGFAVLEAEPRPAAESKDDTSGEEGQDAPWLPSTIEVQQRYEAHGSIAYGADWYQHQRVTNGANCCSLGLENSGSTHSGLVATCSFYDRLLHLWQAW